MNIITIGKIHHKRGFTGIEFVEIHQAALPGVK